MAGTRTNLPAPRWGRSKVAEVFGADLRSLAALRVVLAVIVLVDLVDRIPNLTAHYADLGVLPRAALLEQLSPWQVSLHLMNGTSAVQALLFGVTALAATALLVGYRTRLMIVVVWLMVLSLQWRNPFVLNAGDSLLRLLLFWGMFLPLGACWSVDRARGGKPARPPMRFLSVATAGLFLQIAFVYWFTVLLKSGREWRVDGTALSYALSVEQWTTPLGESLLRFPGLLKVLTFATLGVEAGAVCLLFVPVLTGPVRTAAVLAVAGLHVGIWLTMYVGLFPWLSSLCMVCFLPAWFWDVAVPRVRAAFSRPSGTVSRRFRAAAGPVRAPRLPLRAWSSALGPGGRLPIAALAGGASPLRFGGHAARPSVSPAAWTLPTTGAGARPARSSPAINLLALVFLGYVFLVNLTTVSGFVMPERAWVLGPLLGLGQQWNMFAPYPGKLTSWYVVPGTLADGRQIDLMKPTIHRDPGLFEEVSWEEPEAVRETFGEEERWRKYLETIGNDDLSDLRLYFGRYICRNWNGANRDTPAELKTFDIVLLTRETLLDGRRATPQREELWEHTCG